jgi:uncharacterized protein with von Willebrand factor type A (vWA) domain
MKMDDAYTAYVEENEMKSDEFSFDKGGDFIFFLDRSGSMSGARI